MALNALTIGGRSVPVEALPGANAALKPGTASALGKAADRFLADYHPEAGPVSRVKIIPNLAYPMLLSQPDSNLDGVENYLTIPAALLGRGAISGNRFPAFPQFDPAAVLEEYLSDRYARVCLTYRYGLGFPGVRLEGIEKGDYAKPHGLREIAHDLGGRSINGVQLESNHESFRQILSAAQDDFIKALRGRRVGLNLSDILEVLDVEGAIPVSYFYQALKPRLGPGVNEFIFYNWVFFMGVCSAGEFGLIRPDRILLKYHNLDLTQRIEPGLYFDLCQREAGSVLLVRDPQSVVDFFGKIGRKIMDQERMKIAWLEDQAKRAGSPHLWRWAMRQWRERIRIEEAEGRITAIQSANYGAQSVKEAILDKLKKKRGKDPCLTLDEIWQACRKDFPELSKSVCYAHLSDLLKEEVIAVGSSRYAWVKQKKYAAFHRALPNMPRPRSRKTSFAFKFVWAALYPYGKDGLTLSELYEKTRKLGSHFSDSAIKLVLNHPVMGRYFRMKGEKYMLRRKLKGTG